MSSSITIPEGDTARDLYFVLEDANGPADLNGVTVTLKLTDPDSGAAESELCTVVNPTAPEGDPDRGRCRVPAALRAAWASGEYEAEVEAEYVGGALDVWPSEAHNLVRIRPRRTV